MVRRRIFALIIVTVLLSSAVFGQSVDLDTLLDEVDAQFDWDPFREVGVLRKGPFRLSFRPGEPTAVLNFSRTVHLPDVRYTGRTIVFSEQSAEQIVSIFSPREDSSRRRRVGAIFIDPGHGGRDPGAIGRHVVDGVDVETNEKDVVLTVGLRLEALLREHFPHKEIVLSRDEDVYLTLEERTAVANEIEYEPGDAILFLSIHANASLNSRATGFEVWYLPEDYRRPDLVSPTLVGTQDPEVLSILNTIREEEFSVESILLAQRILGGLDGEIGVVSPNRGLKEETWYVVRNARMPSVLVEVGFVTNAEEGVRLRQDTYLNQLALGIYNGITSFIEDYEK
jgi:N-acetylmuramoyl-L-alanine amidase